MSRQFISICLLMIMPSVVWGKEESPQGAASPPKTWGHNVSNPRKGESFLTTILWKSSQTAMYLGIWGAHFVNNHEDYNNQHDLIEVCINGYLTGTFINSLNNRGWADGFQRNVYRNGGNGLQIALGYRAGLIYGYE